MYETSACARQVLMYTSDNRNPPQCPPGELSIIGPTLFTLRCSPLVNGAGQLSAWTNFLGALCP